MKLDQITPKYVELCCSYGLGLVLDAVGFARLFGIPRMMKGFARNVHASDRLDRQAASKTFCEFHRLVFRHAVTHP